MSEEVKSEGKQSQRKRATLIPKLIVGQIKQEYLEGKGSIKELSVKYGVSSKAISERCYRENWRATSEEIAQKAVEIVEKREDLRLKRLHSHEERMLKRMEERLVSVDKTIAQTNDLVEPSDLRAIVSTEATIDQVIRRNLGAEEKVNVSGSIDVNVVAILEKLRGMERKPIDVESEEAELSSCKLIED